MVRPGPSPHPFFGKYTEQVRRKLEEAALQVLSDGLIRARNALRVAFDPGTSGRNCIRQYVRGAAAQGRVSLAGHIVAAACTSLARRASEGAQHDARPHGRVCYGVRKPVGGLK